LVQESVGIRGIARIMNIACGAVLRRIQQVALGISKPVQQAGELDLEVDELWAFKMKLQ
jgi:hypothetical protein